jgi:hypothetical protein
MGLDFDPLTGEPTAWNLPEPAIVTWYQEATAYAVMKWPSLAAHSRASVADALATVTPALTRPDARRRPDPREMRTVLYQHAFNPVRPAEPGSPAEQILDWAQQASLPVGCLSEPAVLRTALEALTFRLDGSRAAANTIIRKRVVLHGVLGYAAEAGLLPDNPLDGFGWQVPQSSAAIDPVVVASPAQVSSLLDAVAWIRPEMTAFFGCLYYAALRPEEAVALRYADCHLPGSGFGLDMSRFPTPQALVSWAGLTPTARQSGPRKGRGKKGHGNTYAKRIAVLAAYAAANTDTFLGERFRRLSSRPGGGGRTKAGCAVGRSILVIVWHLLNDPAARYRDLGPDWHARHTDRSRKARNARRQLEALGYDVIITLREDAA